MNSKNELVVIFHGIATLRERMFLLERTIRKSGFDTLNVSYPSTRLSIEDSATFVRDKITPQINHSYSAVHFVGHSMGGLVILDLLLRYSFQKAKRAVLIGTPYYGSEAADFVQHWKFYKRLYGPAGGQLTSRFRHASEYPAPLHVDIGVIAGTRGRLYLPFRPIMGKTGLHDGVVSVQSTAIPWVNHHITIRASHTFLIERSGSQVVYFLNHGTFKNVPDMPQTVLSSLSLRLRLKQIKKLDSDYHP